MAPLSRSSVHFPENHVLSSISSGISSFSNKQHHPFRLATVVSLSGFIFVVATLYGDVFLRKISNFVTQVGWLLYQ
jgi:hypothetical protein